MCVQYCHINVLIYFVMMLTLKYKIMITVGTGKDSETIFYFFYISLLWFKLR